MEQLEELGEGCDILIGAPGRLIDFMQRGNVLSLSSVKYTIIDEADEVVSPDWADETRQTIGGAGSSIFDIMKSAALLQVTDFRDD